jgi:hypothetical protein
MPCSSFPEGWFLGSAERDGVAAGCCSFLSAGRAALGEGVAAGRVVSLDVPPAAGLAAGRFGSPGVAEGGCCCIFGCACDASGRGGVVPP